MTILGTLVNPCPVSFQWRFLGSSLGFPSFLGQSVQLSPKKRHRRTAPSHRVPALAANDGARDDVALLALVQGTVEVADEAGGFASVGDFWKKKTWENVGNMWGKWDGSTISCFILIGYEHYEQLFHTFPTELFFKKLVEEMKTALGFALQCCACSGILLVISLVSLFGNKVLMSCIL